MGRTNCPLLDNLTVSMVYLRVRICQELYRMSRIGARSEVHRNPVTFSLPFRNRYSRFQNWPSLSVKSRSPQTVSLELPFVDSVRLRDVRKQQFRFSLMRVIFSGRKDPLCAYVCDFQYRIYCLPISRLIRRMPEIVISLKNQP